jgi:hypothetical protein
MLTKPTFNRIRKIKCDEEKPSCQKCVKTGRTCDGYESNFRFCISQPTGRADIAGIQSDTGLKPMYPASVEVAAEDVHLLNRYFSTKTLFNVKLDCNEEARRVLEASLTDTPIRHALSSLKALRRDLETSGDDPTSITRQKSSYHYGLQQYNMALKGLASKLSSPDANELKSALFCCQIFISIEQVRKNYAAMAKHIIQGLKIMHEYRARPYFVTTNRLNPAHHNQLPLLDVFIIKLFAAPCKFADPPVATETPSSVCPISTYQNATESPSLRTLAPDMRTELRRIAGLTLEFLSKLSLVDSIEIALTQMSERAALLDSLNSWLVNLEAIRNETETYGFKPISTSFLRMFHLMLKIVLLGALDTSSDLNVTLRTENDRLQTLADNVGERVTNYITCSGSNTAR